MGAIMKKLVFVGLSILLSACGVDDSEYEVSYYEHDNGVISGYSLAFNLYEPVISEAYYDAFNSSRALKSDYKLTYRDSVGDEVSSNSYSINGEINNALKKCSKVKFKKSDIVATGGLSDRLFGFVFSDNYAISNKAKIAEIQYCAGKIMAEYPLGLDTLARFTADDRLEKYQSTELNNQLIEVKSDGKFTFNELVSVYKILDKNIENNINSNFMKSN